MTKSDLNVKKKKTFSTIIIGHQVEMSQNCFKLCNKLEAWQYNQGLLNLEQTQNACQKWVFQH